MQRCVACDTRLESKRLVCAVHSPCAAGAAR